VTLSITALAMLFAVLIGGIAGIVAARSNGGPLDMVITGICSILGTLPAFVIAIALISVVSVQAGLLPSGGLSSARDATVTTGTRSSVS